VSLGVITKSGTWLSFKDPSTNEEIRLGQGKERVRDFLQDNLDLCAAIDKAIRARAGALPVVPISGAESESSSAGREEDGVDGSESVLPTPAGRAAATVGGAPRSSAARAPRSGAANGTA
jgi:recombination protein RecA